MLDTIYSQVAGAIVLLVAGFAFWKGDVPEKRGAGIIGVAFLASIIIQDQSDYDSIAIMGVDVVVLCALGLLAWNSDRNWPIWATACQSIVVASHFAYLLDFQISVRAYLNAQALAAYAVIFCLAAGTFIAWREREALKGMT